MYPAFVGKESSIYLHLKEDVIINNPVSRLPDVQSSFVDLHMELASPRNPDTYTL